MAVETIKQETLRGITVAALKISRDRFDVVYCREGNLDSTIEKAYECMTRNKKEFLYMPLSMRDQYRLKLTESQALKRFDTLVQTLQDKNITVVFYYD
jgi:hypothetical protein